MGAQQRLLVENLDQAAVEKMRQAKSLGSLGRGCDRDIRRDRIDDAGIAVPRQRADAVNVAYVEFLEAVRERLAGIADLPPRHGGDLPAALLEIADQISLSGIGAKNDGRAVVHFLRSFSKCSASRSAPRPSTAIRPVADIEARRGAIGDEAEHRFREQFGGDIGAAPEEDRGAELLPRVALAKLVVRKRHHHHRQTARGRLVNADAAAEQGEIATREQPGYVPRLDMQHGAVARIPSIQARTASNCWDFATRT